jgi:hypothetical protein
MSQPVDIQFALVSHTNNGKTTLARTLVGIDVGEVRDAAHVTVFAESHVLQNSAEQGDRLLLWDTPGFGDSVRLLKRLAMPAIRSAGSCARCSTATATARSGSASRRCARPGRGRRRAVPREFVRDPRDAGYLPPRCASWNGWASRSWSC